MNRVLLICNDTVGENMAGPGIRYWEFARALSRSFDVVLAVPPFVPFSTPSATGHLPATLQHCTRPHELRRLAESCDVMITIGTVLLYYPFLGELDTPLVIDLYDPFLLENLQREAGADALKRLSSHEGYLKGLQAQMQVGDFFICADEKQRDYWLGALSATGRVNPYTYQHDVALRRLIDVVPFGLPATPPEHKRSVLKGVYKGIDPGDKVILWGGGIWNWLDADTLIRAMPLVLAQRTDVKLFFMGIERPHSDSAGRQAADQAVGLSKDVGLYEQHIFFNDWVPYEERQNYLLEADIGASLHLDHIETRFSFRTRLLDYLWASLPTIATAGDALSEVLAAEGLAYPVAPGQVDQVAETILSMIDDWPLANREPAFRRVAARYHWDRVVQPLAEYCASPCPAPDRSYVRRQGHSLAHPGSARGLLWKGWRALRLRGLSGILGQGREYLGWRLRKMGFFERGQHRH